MLTPTQPHEVVSNLSCRGVSYINVAWVFLCILTLNYYAATGFLLNSEKTVEERSYLTNLCLFLSFLDISFMLCLSVPHLHLCGISITSLSTIFIIVYNITNRQLSLEESVPFQYLLASSSLRFSSGMIYWIGLCNKSLCKKRAVEFQETLVN